jgi:uncharacterized MAPEG superfamily protein
MLLPVLPVLATLLALVLYVFVLVNVSRARARYKVEAPRMTGDPAFERVARVQQNTTEQLVLFLPSLWLFVLLVSPLWGGVVGLLWVAARIFYVWSYYRDAASRGPGFGLSFILTAVLLVGALVAALTRLASTL